MLIACGICHRLYDDAKCWTICPHEQFMPDEDLAQKDAGLKLLGKCVLFRHYPDGVQPAKVVSVNYVGMVSLEGWVGEFKPSLFVEAEGFSAAGQRAVITGHVEGNRPPEKEEDQR